jgi:hypothetical protein
MKHDEFDPETEPSTQVPTLDTGACNLYVRTHPGQPEQQEGSRATSEKFARYAAARISRRGNFYVAVVTGTGGYVAVYRNGQELNAEAAAAAIITPAGTAAEQLAAIGRAERAAKTAKPGAIRAARDEGLSWEKIGALLGMSAQGAWTAYEQAGARAARTAARDARRSGAAA